MRHPNPLDYGWWLASRSSGAVALALMTVSVTVGLLMASKLVRRRGAPAKLRRLHETTTLTGLVAIAVHGLTLLGDSWLHPGVGGVAVPFALSYRRPFTGIGIIGGYLAALLGLTFYARRRIGARLWRRMHRLVIVAYVLSVAHAIGAGTDASVPEVREAILISAIPVAALFAVRMLPRRPPKPQRGVPAGHAALETPR